MTEFDHDKVIVLNFFLVFLKGLGYIQSLGNPQVVYKWKVTWCRCSVNENQSSPGVTLQIFLC